MNTATLGTWPARRLRLKHHVFFRDTPAGVQFDGGSRSLLLPAVAGTGLHQLVERVIALMDQGLDLPALQARLPERLQAPVQRVVQALDAHGLLLDETDDTPWLQQADVPLALAEFIKYLQDRAEPATRRARWATWSSATVLLAGDGHALKAAARALADSGAGTLRLRAGDSVIGLDELREHLLDAGIAGQVLDVKAGAPQAADFAGVTALLWASDRSDAAPQAAAFEDDARRHAVPAVIALRSGGMALVAPPIEPGLPGVRELLQWQQAGADEPHSPASLALMGVVAAQGVMDHHFGIGRAQWQRRVRRVSPYLELSQHPLVAAGDRDLATLAPQAFADLLGQPSDRTLSGYEQQRVALTPWFDATFGPLSWRPAGAGGQVLSQLPLYHDAIAIRAPQARGGTVTHVVGWGLNAEQAGTRALQLALSQLAAKLQVGHDAAEFVTAFDDDRWQALALAQAVAAHPHFDAERHVAHVELAQVQDSVVHLLRQLLHHFVPTPARVLLHWHPRFAACVAQVYVGDTLAGSACDATALPALQEALGQACSSVQLNDDSLWRGRAWLWPAPQSHQWQPAPADLNATPAGRPARLQWHKAHTLNLPAGVHCGRAFIDPREALA